MLETKLKSHLNIDFKMGKNRMVSMFFDFFLEVKADFIFIKIKIKSPNSEMLLHQDPIFEK